MIAFWTLVLLSVCLLIIHYVVSYGVKRQATPYDFHCPRKREAFERWHDHKTEQLGAASNILFVVAAAGFGFSVTLLADNNRSLVQNHALLYHLFTSTFAVSLILGLISIFNRLYDFRWTAHRHKLRDMRDAETNEERRTKLAQQARQLYTTTNRLGAWTWALLYSQAAFFFFGCVLVCLFWNATYPGEL